MHSSRSLTRRSFQQSLAGAAAVASLAAVGRGGPTGGYRLGTFQSDVTPPLGSPLCGGLVPDVAEVADPLQALGIVLLGAGDPVVLCAVDWCEIRNQDHLYWREALARAAGTSADRVAVQSLHQHDAPIADTAAQGLLQGGQQALRVHDEAWFRRAVAVTAEAVGNALDKTHPLTHLAVGQAKVDRVASTRRVMGPDGRVLHVRTSATRDAAVRAAPEGLIDPWLKSMAFFQDDRKLAVLHYYATHPMSHYGHGQVSCDFVGLARRQRTADDGVPHVYFTGCGGNVTAGKYNDGDPANRAVLTERVLDAMRKSEEAMRRFPVEQMSWETVSQVVPPRGDVGDDELLARLQDPAQSPATRIGAAMHLAYRRRAAAGAPICFSCLRAGPLRVVHLPGEPFVEYQLAAQEAAPDTFVAVAGYGDGGPGYLPLEKSFAEGGYEPTWAFAAPESEKLVRDAVAKLVGT